MAKSTWLTWKTRPELVELARKRPELAASIEAEIRRRAAARMAKSEIVAMQVGSYAPPNVSAFNRLRRRAA